MVPYYYNLIWFHSLGYCCFLGFYSRPRRSLNMHKYHSEIVQETIPNWQNIDWSVKNVGSRTPEIIPFSRRHVTRGALNGLRNLDMSRYSPLRKTLIMGVVNDNVFVFSARSIEVCFCLSWKSIRSIALPRALGYKSGLRFKAAYKG